MFLQRNRGVSFEQLASDKGTLKMFIPSVMA